MTSRIRVLNTYPIRPIDLDMLKQISDRVVIVCKSMYLSDLDVLEESDFEILLAPRGPRPLGRMPQLRWLQVASAGIDKLIADETLHEGITVTNGRGVYATSIAEYVAWALLDHNQKGRARRDVQMTRRWTKDESSVTGTPLRGQTVLIAGYGTVGRETARLLSTLGMKILAVKARPEQRADDSFRLPGTGDPNGNLPDEIDTVAALPRMAARSDAFVNTLPLTSLTRGIISAEILSAFPRSSVIVNVGRGPTLDEAALLRALNDNRLAGAYLDVFSDEPLPIADPLWSHPRVTVTTHISGGDKDHRLLYQLFAENLRRYLGGERLFNVVEASRGY
jgi:phosphoglycerate dehydrogenase-like enzyme